MIIKNNGNEKMGIIVVTGSWSCANGDI